MNIKYKLAKVYERCGDMVTLQETSCPHIEGIPLYHYLPYGSWGDKGLVLKGLLLSQVQYEFPETFPETSEDSRKGEEVRSWNKELGNWKEVRKSSWDVDSLNDKDENRLEVTTTVYWEHPVYGKAWAAPEPKEEDKVVEETRRALWLQAQKPLWYERAYQEWLEVNKSFLQKAIEDKGSFHQQQEEKALVLKQQLEKEAKVKATQWQTFAKECQEIGKAYGVRVTPSGMKVYINEKGQISCFDSVEGLESFLKELKTKVLPTGKPKPRKKG
jgi:hypothetical protein